MSESIAGTLHPLVCSRLSQPPYQDIHLLVGSLYAPMMTLLPIHKKLSDRLDREKFSVVKGKNANGKILVQPHHCPTAKVSDPDLMSAGS